jgi:hypothetical protein
MHDRRKLRCTHIDLLVEVASHISNDCIREGTMYTGVVEVDRPIESPYEESSTTCTSVFRLPSPIDES